MILLRKLVSIPFDGCYLASDAEYMLKGFECKRLLCASPSISSKMANDPFRSTDFNLTIPERITAYLNCLTQPEQYKGFETHPLQQVEFVSHSASLRQMIYRVVVPPSLCNKDSVLHGGAATTILDNLSSTALFTVARPGFWENMGVSRSLYVVFHRAVPVGSSMLITCEVASAGRNMATLRAEMRVEAGGALCVSCVHDKFHTGVPKAMI